MQMYMKYVYLPLNDNLIFNHLFINKTNTFDENIKKYLLEILYKSVF